MEVNKKPESIGGLKSLRGFIKNIDFFGVTFNFRSDHRQKFSSVCSGIVFLFFCIFLLTFILNSFSDYISFSDYRIQYMQKYNQNSNLQITKNNFFYSIRFTYIEGVSYEDILHPEKAENRTYSRNFGEELNVFGSKYEKLFEIDNSYVEKTLNPPYTSLTSKKAKIANYKCDKNQLKNSDFYNLLVQEKYNPLTADYEESFTVQEHLCFNYSDYTLFGKYSDNDFSYFEITLKLNETNYKENPIALKNFLSKIVFKFAIYYSDHIYDLSNLNDPIQKRTELTVYSYFDLFYNKRVNMFFNELLYYTHKNLLLKDPLERKKIKF